MMQVTSPSAAASDVLAALSSRHNVLIAGAPATGKTRLLSEVAALFSSHVPQQGASPTLVRRSPVPIQGRSAATGVSVMPSPTRTDRRVFRTAFHQGSKARDFLTGIVPELSGGASQFRVSEGILYRASEHARTSNGASLLIIDEINRGPAVQVFGGAIVAMEGEKRLAPDGSQQNETQVFELIEPSTGKLVEYALPHDLYLLGAMNQADVSVEPLDVAFLRRWAPYPLEPDAGALRAALGIGSGSSAPAVAANAEDVYAAVVAAWEAVNDRIALGRGPEFRLGHGILLTRRPASSLDDALDHAIAAWRSIRAHVDEVFFGDVRGVATVLNATDGHPGHIYQLTQKNFGDMPSSILLGPTAPTRQDVYGMLLAVAVPDGG